VLGRAEEPCRAQKTVTGKPFRGCAMPASRGSAATTTVLLRGTAESVHGPEAAAGIVRGGDSGADAVHVPEVRRIHQGNGESRTGHLLVDEASVGQEDICEKAAVPVGPDDIQLQGNGIARTHEAEQGLTRLAAERTLVPLGRVDQQQANPDR
jgi:hypothetical protein